ncbi:MAG: hypothetical protein ACK4RK_11990 [Gemmataceae bacterium]
MNSLRLLPNYGGISEPCLNCREGERHWDRIAGRPYCPNCQEALAQGEAEPLVMRTEKHRCAVCGTLGTVRFTTFPRQSGSVLEIDLCAEHLRALLGRRLGQHAFQQLCRLLQTLSLNVESIFLLHGAFYDRQGRALHPVAEVE